MVPLGYVFIGTEEKKQNILFMAENVSPEVQTGYFSLNIRCDTSKLKRSA
jgi:hypothetical protein